MHLRSGIFQKNSIHKFFDKRCFFQAFPKWILVYFYPPRIRSAMVNETELKFQLALCLIPGVGSLTAKKLVSYCGGVEAVFRERKTTLLKIPGIGEQLSQSLLDHSVFDRAEQEMAFIKKHTIGVLFYLDKEYPARLKHCDDSPFLLFTKGNANLNAQKVVGIVGTRNMTSYGREQCNALIEGLKKHQPLIVSGLAYGVDACAHKKSLEEGLATAGVLGHGLDRIYPAPHKQLAQRMVNQGILVTEFFSQTKPDRENFPTRNRIIAGLCDALVVIEAASTGGALITAIAANTYNRDVFALPGRTSDAFSKGCNWLIKSHKACLIEDINDLEYIMGWDATQSNQKNIQRQLFVELNQEEQIMADYLKNTQEAHIDQIVAQAGFTVSKTSTLLLQLEFKGVVRSLPGKVYKLTSA